MEDTREKILIFSSRELCYRSSNFFACQMADAFEKLGYETKVCAFTKEDDLDTIFHPLMGKTYKLILDFNSLLPRMVEEDGTPILDLLEGPFYDYILDHPLFHYKGLSAKVKNFNAILLDEAQQKYVDTYYSNVKNTVMMPLSATEAFTQEKTSDLANGILFMGTYDGPEHVYEIIQAAPQPLRSYMQTLIEMRMAEPTLPMEDAFLQLLAKEEIQLPKEQFSLLMNAMYSVDSYIRDYFRKETLDALAQAHIPVKLVGEGWEKYQSPYEACVTREKPVTFGLSFEKIAKEHILLNVSPIFNRGAHDRIFAGMANRCVVLTDENPYLRRTFLDGENICLYSLKDRKTLTAAAEELMTNPVRCKEIQEAAYREFKTKHTWQCRATQLLGEIG